MAIPKTIKQMSDVELYNEWQEAKEDGPTSRIDDLQLEISQRWEEVVERECDV